MAPPRLGLLVLAARRLGSTGGPSATGRACFHATRGSENSSAPPPPPPPPQQQQQQKHEPPLQPPTVGKLSGDELWMAGVAGRCKVWAARSYPALKGREKEISEAVRREFDATLARRLGGGDGGPAPAASPDDAPAAAASPSPSPPASASSSLLPELARSSPRARVQLRQACLAAATQRVFARELGGSPEADEEAARAVAEAMGSLHAPFFLGALQATSWFRRVLLRQRPFDQACQTLEKLGRDMSGAASVERLPPARGAGDGERSDDDDDEDDKGREEGGGDRGNKENNDHKGPPVQGEHATLRVTSCGVADLLRAEGVAELLAPSFCCGHARSWFGAYEGQGVRASLDASLMRSRQPAGGGCCRLRVYTQQQQKQ
jgi:hypothetical protein